MSPTLLPCPFCGSAAKLSRIDYRLDPTYDVECDSCWVWGRWATEAAAITAWNTRALEREAKAEPVAWARRWYVDGVKPFKVKNENGRMVWAAQFHWKPVTESKLFSDDVALYASPPAPESE